MFIMLQVEIIQDSYSRISKKIWLIKKISIKLRIKLHKPWVFPFSPLCSKPFLAEHLGRLLIWVLYCALSGLSNFQGAELWNASAFFSSKIIKIEEQHFLFCCSFWTFFLPHRHWLPNQWGVHNKHDSISFSFANTTYHKPC